MLMEGERRESLRLPFTEKAVCRILTEEKEMVSYDGTIKDLSIEGMFIQSTRQPRQNAECIMSITLEAEHSILEIREVKGKVARINKDGFAVAFSQRLEWFALIPIYFGEVNEVRVE